MMTKVLVNSRKLPCERVTNERKLTVRNERIIARSGSVTDRSFTAVNLVNFSTGGPTYWPTDPNKLPDLLDFLFTRGLPTTDIQVVPVFELSSDHSPIIASIGASLTNKAVTPTLATIHTNWDMFRAYIDEHINLHLRIKECAELDEAIQYFTTLIQTAGWYSTPHPAQRGSLLTTLLSTYAS